MTYTLDGETYSTELIAQSSVLESNFEIIIIRILLIILIFILFIIILGKLNRPKKRGKSHNSSRSKNKNCKKTTSRKGGRYKFTQINEYL